MPGTLRVGTRSSPLALRQTELVLRVLRRASPRNSFEVVPMKSQGDRVPGSSGKRDFTDVIDAALEAGEVDLAVHSAKDLPTRSPRRVVLAATPRRGDPRDALVLRSATSWMDLPHAARVGSSSVRRRAELLRVRPDLRVVEIRGNVGTRLVRMEERGLDGVILAVAGLQRIGQSARITQRLPWRSFPPAPGQGAIAVHARPRDLSTRRLLSIVDDPSTHACVSAERAFAAALGVDCDVPVGTLARRVRGRLELWATLLSPDGAQGVSGSLAGALPEARAIGRTLARELARAGGSEVLRLSR